MHFEFLTEDQSSAVAMEILIPKILGNNVTYKIHPFKGIGHIPKDLRPRQDAKKRLLLDQLPKLLRGYGRSPRRDIIVVICDLDDRDKKKFLSELYGVLKACDPKPNALFCLAVEEFEAWYLGDLKAVRLAYPAADETVLNGYVNDSICGTWEVLADAIYAGGHEALIKEGWRTVGLYKSIWAKTISPHMNIDENVSDSFCFLCSKLRSVTA